MRLEINAFFMHREDTDSFCRSFEEMTEHAESVAESFAAIRSAMCDISGGIGCLQNALDEIDARIREENTVSENLTELNRQAEAFVDEVIDTDNAVAKIIHKEKDKFYKVNPWAVPPEPETDDRAWWEKGWDALCDFAGDIVDAACDFFNDAVDFVRDIGNAIFDFCHDAIEVIRDAGHWAIETFINGCEQAWNWIVDHRRALIEVAIGAVIIAGLAIATVCTGGAAAAICGAALVGACVCGGVGAVSGGISAANSGEDIFDGIAKGFMCGTISGGVLGALDEAFPGLAGTPIHGLVAGGCAAFGETIHSLLDDGHISSEEGMEIAKSGISSGLTDIGVGNLPRVFGFEKGLSIGNIIGTAFGDNLVSNIVGSTIEETIGTVVGNFITDPLVDVAFDLGGQAFDFIMEHPDQLLIGPIGPLIPVLPPIQPPTPLLPNFDINIDIDINIDFDITFDFRPFCFSPVIAGPVLGPIVNIFS